MQLGLFFQLASVLSAVLAIPGKTERFHQLDSAETEWTWVGRLSDRYKFNAEAQQVLHKRLIASYMYAIPKAPAMIYPENPVTILLLETEGFAKMMADPGEWTAQCPVPCKVTFDRSEIGSAHIVMTTGEQVPSEFSMLKPYQQKALFDLEPDLSLPNAKFRISPYDLLVSYSHLSDVRVDYTRSLGYPKVMVRDLSRKKANKALAVAFVSNCESNGDARYRLDYLRELSVHMPIHFFGSCLHTPDLPTNVTFDEVADDYYFALAFENSILDDYVTDKFYQALAADTVPVYMGAPNIAEFLPEHDNNRIIVEARQFPDPASLASHLKLLAQDDTEYLEYFDWRDHVLDKSFSQAYNFENKGAESFACRMCTLYNDRVEK